MRRAAVLLLASVLAAGAAAAQQVQPPKVGARIRVSAPALEATDVVGTALGFRRGVLLVRPDGRRDSLAIPRRQIAKLEVASRRGHAVLGTELGFVAGAIVGGINGTRGACRNGYNCSGWHTGFGGAALGAATFGLLAAPVGAIAGALVRTEQWRSVDLGAARLSASVMDRDRHALTIGVSVRF